MMAISRGGVQARPNGKCWSNLMLIRLEKIMTTGIRSVLTLAILVIVSLALAIPADAATFTYTIGSETITIVEADPFKSGDTAGNTVRAVTPGSFWGSTSTSNGDSLWRERPINAFVTGYESIPGATDRLYEVGSSDRTNAPELVTTISGLAPAASGYEVNLIYASRIDGNPSNAGILGDLNGSATTPHAHTNNDYDLGSGPGWAAHMGALGTTTPGDTSFTVNVKGTTAYGRNDYIGVAYKAIPVVADLVFQADLEMTGGEAANQRTQAAWDSGQIGNSGNGSSVSSTFGGIGVTVTATGAGGELQGRGGSAQGRSDLMMGTSWNNMVEDIWAARNGDGNMEIALTGLTDGTTYTLTGWHNESYLGVNEGFATDEGYLITPSLLLGTLVGVVDAGASSNLRETDSLTDALFDTSIISFMADGTNATILYTGESTSDYLALSGLQLQGVSAANVVPEPGTFALATLGLLGLTWFGWRKKK